MNSEKNNLHPREIVSSYAELLASINDDKASESLTIIPKALPESLLPFPSKTIRHALAIYLLHQNYNNKRAIIEDAYIYLDNFIPDEEYNLFYMLQNTKGSPNNQSNNNIIEIFDIMSKLRTRTENISTRKEKSIEELNALRRIMSLSNIDDIEMPSDQGTIQELGLNI